MLSKNSFLFIVLLLLAGSVHAQKQLKVVGTFSIAADIAQEIGGQYADVNSLIPLGADPHLYEPVPGDVQALREADIIFANGLRLEGWLNRVIANAEASENVVVVSSGVTPIEGGQFVEDSEADHSDHPTDPHAWNDPLNGIIYAQNIKEAYTQRMPQHAGYFQKRFEAYKAALLSLHAEGVKLIHEIKPEHRVLITTHDAFNYLAKRYGLQVVPLKGVSTDAEVRTQDMQAVIRVIESTGVPAVFAEKTNNPKVLQRLQNDYDVVIGGELFSDNLGEPGTSADSYIKMIEHNLNTIHAGLTGQVTGTADASQWLVLLVITSLFGVAFATVALLLKRRTTNRKDDNYILRVEHLSVRYDDKVALKNVSVELKNGAIHGLIGPNGSGKSTFVKAILELVPRVKGEVSLNGEPLSAFAGNIAYVPQKDEVDWQFPATVQDVVTMGRYSHKSVFGRMTADDREKVQDAMRRVGITDLANRQIGELSGGQQRRTFVARALAQEADIFLMDEPFAGIDRATEDAILELLRDLANAGKFVLIIHHDLSKVERYFDDAILLNTELVTYGPSAEVCRPEVINRAFAVPTTHTAAS